ncbi:hypothetical protein AKI39_15195 [Bordetella sp. H567]|uniref:LysR family transcriptional regulator n=1 Tax=Bordetella sp. H567 TaxID=1697043 RepID=UPI00081C70A4|nr:LysR family transcriptional regulator [Bordetella sp. H567]AOB31755.1 hypothetical protein AKI39_15195 [Bordetella sp. H567]
MNHELDKLRGSIGKLQIRHLSLLAAIMDHGSVRRAAAKLYLSQPGASRMINELEAVFGGPLFIRSARGMTANHRAQVLYRSSKAILRELTTAEHEIASESPRRTIVVGALPVVIVELLARVIGALEHDQPNTVIKVRPGTSFELFQRLADGDLDCVIARLPQSQMQGEGYETIRGLLPGLDVEVLYDEPQCLIVGRHHALANARRVTWRAMAQERWLRPPSEGFVHRVLSDGFSAAGYRMPQASVECENFMYAIHIVATTNLLAVVPRREANKFREMVALLPLPAKITAAPIVFASRKLSAADETIASFRESVRSNASA